MTGLAWAPFYWGDYLRDTSHLSLEQHGAYLLLLAHYYSTGKPIQANAKQLFRICSAVAQAEQEAVLSVVQEFFRRDGDFWVHDRVERVIEKQTEISRIRAEAGSKGGRSRVKQLLKQMPKQESKQSEPDPEPESNPEQKVRKPRARNGALVVCPEGVREGVWQDFLAIRKKKRAPLTDTALEGIVREAGKAGISLEAALRKCCERGWQGFEASWLSTQDKRQTAEWSAAQWAEHARQLEEQGL